MDKNKLVLASLAMDLKRVALGLHRGSSAMGVRFMQEAQKRKSEVDPSAMPAYMQSILEKVGHILQNQTDRTAEDALMYGTLLQNYTLKKGV